MDIFCIIQCQNVSLVSVAITAPVDESHRKLICQELSLLFHRIQISGSQALSHYINTNEAGPCIPYSSCLQEVLWKDICLLFSWNFYFVMQDRKYIKCDGLGKFWKSIAFSIDIRLQDNPDWKDLRRSPGHHPSQSNLCSEVIPGFSGLHVAWFS